jgi:hypothetical protein
MEEMERIEQEVFPEARPRSEIIVEVEPPPKSSISQIEEN